jgi:hypothetical protein
LGFRNCREKAAKRGSGRRCTPINADKSILSESARAIDLLRQNSGIAIGALSLTIRSVRARHTCIDADAGSG